MEFPDVLSACRTPPALPRRRQRFPPPATGAETDRGSLSCIGLTGQGSAAVDVEFEVLLRDLVIFAAVAERLYRSVYLFLEFGVVLAKTHADARSQNLQILGNGTLQLATALALV